MPVGRSSACSCPETVTVAGTVFTRGGRCILHFTAGPRSDSNRCRRCLLTVPHDRKVQQPRHACPAYTAACAVAQPSCANLHNGAGEATQRKVRPAGCTLFGTWSLVLGGVETGPPTVPPLVSVLPLVLQYLGWQEHTAREAHRRPRSKPWMRYALLVTQNAPISVNQLCSVFKRTCVLKCQAGAFATCIAIREILPPEARSGASTDWSTHSPAMPAADQNTQAWRRHDELAVSAPAKAPCLSADHAACQATAFGG